MRQEATFSRETLTALWRLEKVILDTLDFDKTVQTIADSILVELGYLKLGYRIVVLALVNKETNTLERISISQTEEAKRALENTPVPFHDIRIPMTQTDNVCITCMQDNAPKIVTDWSYMFSPSYSAQEAKRMQSIVGIKTSIIYPISYHGEIRGIMIFSLIKDQKDIRDEERQLIRGLTDVVGIAVQNARLYSSLDQTKKSLEQANEHLKELDKLKDEFVSVASHELRTPMTAIRSYLWLLIDRKKDQLDAESQEYLNIAFNATERLLHLVKNMLTISRIEGNRLELNKEQINLYEIGKMVYDELAIEIDKKHIARSISEPSMIPVMGDKERLAEVFQNILGNALKFTPTDGKITMTFHTDETSATISISDTGPGLSAEDIQKLFQKFSMIKSSYAKSSTSGGTGLGLFITKRIINLHGGDIRIESTVGTGSTFIFTVPLNQPS
jgi:signal transduction histidine kinase